MALCHRSPIPTLLRSSHETNQEGVTFASKAKKTQDGSAAFTGKDVPRRCLIQRIRMVVRDICRETLDADLNRRLSSPMEMRTRAM
jgi:hypothetical protein